MLALALFLAPVAGGIRVPGASRAQRRCMIEKVQYDKRDRIAFVTLNRPITGSVSVAWI